MLTVGAYIVCHFRPYPCSVPLPSSFPPLPFSSNNSCPLRVITSPSLSFRRYIPLGEDRVAFDRRDVEKIKNLASKGQSPGLRVLGFKRMSSLKMHERVDRSYFVYPDPTKSGTNGRAALVALHNSCLSKNVYALTELILRAGTIPRLCALIPQREERNEGGDQVKSDGFCLVVLPYEDDVR